MKYAILNGERIEPKKGITDAVCPVCKENVIPKCGNIKMHHWAHKSKQNCDPWGENETEWHRKWKDCFPEEYQEIVMYDGATGEKHVADVRTNTGIVIEFQHSAMKREEQISREEFYKNMVWVVDASSSYETFKAHMKILEKSELYKGYFHVTLANCELGQSCFPKRWLKSSVPVIFDFGVHSKSDNEEDKQKKLLYCIFSEKIEDHETTYCGMYITKEDFINKVSNDSSFFPNLEFPKLERQRLERLKAQQKEREKNEEQRVLREARQKEEEERQRKEQLERRKAMMEEDKRKKALKSRQKYPEQKKWREAICELQKKLKNNTLNLIELYVSDTGELKSYSDSETYSRNECIVLSTKPCSTTHDGKDKSQVLLLIEHDNQMIFATTKILTCIVDKIIYKWEDGETFCDCWNYQIRDIDIIQYCGELQLSFKFSEQLCYPEEIKESLEYIDNQFANKYLKTKYPKFLGTDPTDNAEISLKKGPYGLYIEKNIKSADKKSKPPRASVPKFVEADKIDLNLALSLLQLPKTLGEYEGSEVKIGIGRYGPYVFHNGKYVSIPKPEDILTITLDQAIEVLKSKGK